MYSPIYAVKILSGIFNVAKLFPSCFIAVKNLIIMWIYFQWSLSDYYITVWMLLKQPQVLRFVWMSLKALLRVLPMFTIQLFLDLLRVSNTKYPWHIIEYEHHRWKIWMIGPKYENLVTFWFLLVTGLEWHHNSITN